MEERTPVEISGVVDRVVPKAEGRLQIILRDIIYELDGKREELPGKIVWNWRTPDTDPEPGQRVTALLRVVPARNFGNPGMFDYEWYWKRQGVLWRCWPAGKDAPIIWGDSPEGWLWKTKQTLRTSVAGQVPSTQGGALVTALVTGDRSLLTHETLLATRAGGLAHVLALSGLHVGFVAAMGFALAWIAGWIRPSILLSIPRPKLAVLLGAPLVLGYAWLGQPSQSLIRAATMFAFWGVLLLQGRGRVLMDGLFFALAVIVFVTPFSVFDTGLQLSLAAVAGIGLLFPLLRPLFSFGHAWWQRLFGWACGLLGVSLCANLAILPLISWSFGTLSPNLVLNLIWLPVLGFVVMPLGVLGMVLSIGAWSASVGGWVLGVDAMVAGWLLDLLLFAGENGFTPVFQVLRPLWPEMVGSTVLLIVATVAWANRRMLVGLACIGFVLLVWPHVSVMLTDSQNVVRLSLLDVGVGQSAVLSAPGGHRWLIDAGRGSRSFDMGERVVAPYLTYGRPPRLDGVFLSHPDSDHSHGVPYILSRFDVGMFSFNGTFPRGRNGQRLRDVLEQKELLPLVLEAGQELTLRPGISLEILHPVPDFESSHANERSLVMRLLWRDMPLALVPGDVERDGIAALLATGRDLTSDVLIVPHHGSKTSFSSRLYDAVLPKAALCSDGYLNWYGAPDQIVVDNIGVPLFTTSRHGMVSAAWFPDGEMSIRAFLP